MLDKKLFYFGILPALFFQVIGAYFYFVRFEGTGFATWIYSMVKILVVVWPLIWIFRKGFVAKFWAKSSFNKALLYGLFSGLAISAFIFLVYNLGSDQFLEYKENIYAKIVDFGIAEHYLIFSLFLAIIHSFIEEYFWRFFIFNGLQIKFSTFWAAVISSAAFAAHHFIVLSQFTDLGLTLLFGSLVGIGGLIWCYVYAKTQNILSGWISHFFVDAAVMYVGYLIVF